MGEYAESRSQNGALLSGGSCVVELNNHIVRLPWAYSGIMNN